jgi:hypothetical protein
MMKKALEDLFRIQLRLTQSAAAAVVRAWTEKRIIGIQ